MKTINVRGQVFDADKILVEWSFERLPSSDEGLAEANDMRVAIIFEKRANGDKGARIAQLQGPDAVELAAQLGKPELGNV